jgi:hypothetical protein
MAECVVRGCSNAAVEVFRTRNPDAPVLEWLVCAFHGRALDAGEEHALSSDGKELLLGPSSPLRIVDWSITDDELTDGLITLKLGHDGIEEQSVEFFLDPETARKWCGWIGGPEPHDELGNPRQ